MKVLQKHKKQVAVIFGGKSVEHDISIITGVQTLNALNNLNYDIVPIYITKQGLWYTSKYFFDIKNFSNLNLNKDCVKVQLCTDGYLYLVKNKKLKQLCKIDFCFLATHGAEGENGSLQGFLDMCNVSYSSSNVIGSSVCMNKLITKQILQSKGVNITKYVTLFQQEYKSGFEKVKTKILDLKMPFIVKPANLGSSIGISFCKNLSQLKNAISFAFLFDTVVIVEEAVENLKEVNLAVIGNEFMCETSDIEEVKFNKDFLTFENKYLNKKDCKKGIENSSRIIPAILEKEQEEYIRQTGELAFKTLCCKGIVRIDFLINSKTNEIYLNEVNTIPGSLSNYLWKTKKYSFSKLLDKLMDYSCKEKEIKQSKITNFSSNVLKQFDNTSKLCDKSVKIDFKK